VADWTPKPIADADGLHTRAERPWVRVARFVHKDHDAVIADAVLSSGLRHECFASWTTGSSRAAIESAHSGWTVAATLVADADAHYILDPEKFFGQSAGYMMSVILDQDGDADEDAGSRDKWRLLIVEDAAELVGADARLETGQGLARLLNVCDGLVGQGLRVLILLTTNEDVGKMHPAVTRRGRCIANIRFDLLSPDESQEWGFVHGVTTDGQRSALLADLFAADQILTPATNATTGFRPRSRPL
jgi:hypothetical protein